MSIRAFTPAFWLCLATWFSPLARGAEHEHGAIAANAAPPDTVMAVVAR